MTKRVWRKSHRFLELRQQETEAGAAGCAPDGEVNSRLRNSRLAHAVNKLHALGKIDRIVAPFGGFETRDCEMRVESQPRADLRPRLINSIEICEGRCKSEMTERIISVGLNGSAQPGDRLLRSTKNTLWETDYHR